MNTFRVALAGLLVALIPLVLIGRFVATFEIFGLPVHQANAGWLGPTPRDAGDCVVDVGKVNTWECEDISVFEAHRLGTQLWLETLGYTDQPRITET